MDNSFLKLYKNDFAAAVMNDNIPAYGTRWTGYAQQLPHETFMQITNCKESIAFAGNILVELIDICENVIQDITHLFFYTEITGDNGIKQIKYEFGMTNVDYGQELLFLRLTHTTSDKIWYSAGFFITYDNQNETDILHYGNTTYFRGISYDKFDNTVFAPQWIRLQCFKTDGDFEKDGEDEVQLSGRKNSSRSILTPFERHIFYICDFFTYSRLVTVMNHEMIYLNGFRVSNKPNCEKEDRIEDSNLFAASFTANVTEEPLPEIVHLFQFFHLILKVPEGNYLPGTVPVTMIGDFDRGVVLGTGTLTIYDSDGNAVAAFTESDLTMNATGFTRDITGLIVTNDDYHIEITEGLFIGINGESFKIDNTTDWAFSMQDASYYDPIYYDDTYYA